MTDVTKISGYLEQRFDDFLSIYRQIVDVNSHTENIEGVSVVARIVEDAFLKLGFDAERVSSTIPNYGEHLFLTRNGSGTKSVALIAHLDTVFTAEEEKANDFSWRIEGDRLFGPGVSDDKGGIIAILMVLSAISELNPGMFEETTWNVMLDSSEERGAVDFGELLQARLADSCLAALVFEPCTEGDEKNCRLVTSRRGAAVLDISVKGESGHSGNSYHLGVSAIQQLAHTIGEIYKLVDLEKMITINVGKISGGTEFNRIADEASATLDVRASDPDDFYSTIDEIINLSKDLPISVPQTGAKCSVEISKRLILPPWPENSQTSSLLKIWEEAGRDLGLNVESGRRNGGSDANFIWNKVPTLDGLSFLGDNLHKSKRAGDQEQEVAILSTMVPYTLRNIRALESLLRS